MVYESLPRIGIETMTNNKTNEYVIETQKVNRYLTLWAQGLSLKNLAYA